MAENSYRQPSERKNREIKSASWLSEFLTNFSDLDKMIEGGLPTRYIPYLLFLSALGIFYVANSHYAEKMIRELNKSEVETENMRADYTTIKVEFLFRSKQTEITTKAEAIGLIENNGRTFRIVQEPDSLDNKKKKK
jgi:Bacteriodetes cell division protein (FtsL-like)